MMVPLRKQLRGLSKDQDEAATAQITPRERTTIDKPFASGKGQKLANKPEAV
jgi:hypothetical protein